MTIIYIIIGIIIGAVAVITLFGYLWNRGLFLMAEMTTKDAVAVLHNNQYQKHVGNGEYDYIHSLTDAEAKGIERLIQQQAATITELQTEIAYQNKQIARLQEDLIKQVKEGQ